MKLTKDNSIFIMIDLQEKLVPAMENKDELIKNSIKLVKGIDIFNIPKIVSQQYTKGLGETIPEIKEVLGFYYLLEKTSFSCTKNIKFIEQLNYLSDRKNIILCGIESHICVEQTALDLIEMGYNVYLVCDAISSRNIKNMEISLRRLENEGVKLTSTESVLYTLLEDSKASEFKEISSIIK